MALLDLLRFHRNRCVSNGSDGLHRTTFQPSSKYCLHFRFHLMTKLPVTQVDQLYCSSGFIFRLDSVFSTGIWSRVLDMCVICDVNVVSKVSVVGVVDVDGLVGVDSIVTVVCVVIPVCAVDVCRQCSHCIQCSHCS